jgi:Pvc16 N-terminal domain
MSMITSHFKNYKTALEFLSAALRLFQSRNVFTPVDTPSLDGTVERLIVELYSLDFEQQNHLWASLGAKYMPSIMYKVRMLTIQESQKSDEQEPVITINFSDRSIGGK